MRVPWLAAALSAGILAAHSLARIGHVAGIAGLVASGVVLTVLLVAHHRPGAVREVARRTMTMTAAVIYYNYVEDNHWREQSCAALDHPVRVRRSVPADACRVGLHPDSVRGHHAVRRRARRRRLPRGAPHAHRHRARRGARQRGRELHRLGRGPVRRAARGPALGTPVRSARPRHRPRHRLVRPVRLGRGAVRPDGARGAHLHLAARRVRWHARAAGSACSPRSAASRGRRPSASPATPWAPTGSTSPTTSTVSPTPSRASSWSRWWSRWSCTSAAAGATPT